MANRKKVLLGLAIVLVVTAVVSATVRIKASNKHSVDLQRSPVKKGPTRDVATARRKLTKFHVQALQKFTETQARLNGLKKEHADCLKLLESVDEEFTDMDKRLDKWAADNQKDRRRVAQLKEDVQREEQRIEKLLKSIEEIREWLESDDEATEASDQVEEEEQ